MELNKKQIYILEVAERLFAKNGFKGTSVRVIAKEADINIAMISYYFGSKKELLKTLMEYRSLDFRKEVSQVLEQELDYLDKVDELVSFTIKRLHRNHRIHKITNFEYARHTDKEDFSHFIKQKRQNYQIIKDFIKKGQQQGVFRQSVNIPLIITTLTGTYFNFYHHKNFFGQLHEIPESISTDNFIHKQLIPHLQLTIKALLTYED